VNWILLAIVAAAVVGFGSSDRLASAYGVSVMGTMLVTSLLTFFVIRYQWRYALWLSVATTGFFLFVDLAFFTAAMHKVLEGGWFPLVMGAAVFTIMVTWRRGRRELAHRLEEGALPLESFLQSLLATHLARVPGTAVFLTSARDATPHALLHSLKHYKVMHEQNVFLHVEFRDLPWVPDAERLSCESIGNHCWRAVVRYGFMDRPDIPRALAACAACGVATDPMDVSYFLSREKIVPAEGGGAGMAAWRDRLFAAMARNAGSVTDYFAIPTNRVVELGARVEI
jgi:KUP system potassium uptake protein